ncbi:MAG TPA: hypothetical protein DCX22_01250 [Dehalococcoidia bacterium]|nr:hypothetical protein [Dehalococcoidia bacterium]
MSTSKRVFFYIVSLVGLGVFAGGIGNLLRLLFDITIRSDISTIGDAAFTRDQLSFGIAMLIIGGLLWFFFWRNIQTNVKNNVAEVASVVRKFYINIILLVSALIALLFAMDFFQWLLSGVPLISFSPDTTATMIVSAAVWYYHWNIELKEGQPSSSAKTLRRWYMYIMCAWTLCWFTFGLVHLVHAAVLYMPVWETTITYGSFWNSNVHSSISSILIGGVLWVFHWFHAAKNDFGSSLRNVYLYLFTIFGGALAGLIALTSFVYQILRFFISGTSAADPRYFQFLGWTIPTVIVAGAVWAYHQQKAQEEASSGDTQYFSARRVLFYLMAFIGLGTLVAGLLMLLGILLDVWINAASSGTVIIAAGWWHNQLALSLAMLIVAAPVWYYYWNQVMRMVARGGIEEWRARSRRIFLYVVLGVTIIALTAALVNIVYQLLNGFLQGDFGIDVLRQSKWSLQTLVVAAPVLIYHLSVLRQDQRRGAETIVQQKTVTVLADERSADLIIRLEKELGYSVRRLIISSTPEMQSSAELSEQDITSLVNDIRQASTRKVMVIAAAEKLLVVPYEEK